MSKVPKKAAQLTTRTGAQVGVPAAIIGLLGVFNVIHWTPEQTAAVLLASSVLGAAVQNLVEQATGRRWLR